MSFETEKIKDRVIAIIPARSGSKGLKDKNIRSLCGKPLLAYTIETAQASGLFDCIHVSTDSGRYAEIARNYGADVPFLRNSQYALDNSITWEVVGDVLEQYKNIAKEFDVVAVLQPTSPLRSKKNIIESNKMFYHKNANTIISVCESEHSPYWNNTIHDDGNMEGFIKTEYWGKTRQELPQTYRINGAIYWIRVDVLNNLKNLYDDKCFAYIMSKYESIDIDDELDFKLAEVLMKEK